MRICVIGAGITGLAVARLLQKKHEVIIYEKDNDIGGIAKTKDIDGVAYHMVGGHCFNSKNKDVMDYVFNEVLPEDQWHQVVRDAKINFQSHLISYPIEYSIREIAKFDNDLAIKMVKDFIMAENQDVENLADWFKQRFGKTLAEEYFIPYNQKIWKTDPYKMSHLWVEGKLPLPNKDDFIQSLIGESKDEMPHSTFYYPNSNNQNTFIEALSKGGDVINNYEVKSIEIKEKKWLINNTEVFDLVISTLPLNILPNIIVDAPDSVKAEAKKLKYNKVTNVLWKTKDIDATWTYFPSKDTLFHRHIHIGNFFIPKRNYTITESIGEHSFDEVVSSGKKLDYLIEPLDYNVSDHAYVVYDKNVNKATAAIQEYLKSIQLFSIGRFGEWEYYNMDKCIESAMNLAFRINKK